MSLTYTQIDSLTDAFTENARALIFEAQTLQNVASFARAFSLAHLAREELAKCTILYAAGMRMLAGTDVDWAKTMRRLRSHKAKLEVEIVGQLMLLGWNEKLGAVLNMADYRNNRKNASLYVEIKDGKAVRPADVVTENQAFRTIELAKFALEFQMKTRDVSGLFANRTPETMQEISKIVSMSHEQLKAAAKVIAPMHQVVVALLMSENQSKKDS